MRRRSTNRKICHFGFQIWNIFSNNFIAFSKLKAIKFQLVAFLKRPTRTSFFAFDMFEEHVYKKLLTMAGFKLASSEQVECGNGYH